MNATHTTPAPWEDLFVELSASVDRFVETRYKKNVSLAELQSLDLYKPTMTALAEAFTRVDAALVLAREFCFIEEICVLERMRNAMELIRELLEEDSHG